MGCLDKNAAEAFVKALTGDAGSIIRLKMIPETSQAQAADLPIMEVCGTIDELWTQVTRKQAEGYAVYIFANGIKPVPSYAKAKDILEYRVHFADYDKGLPAEWHRHPDIIVYTSQVGGLQKAQAYWLHGPTEENEWRINQKRNVIHYNDDKSVSDPARVLRLPGTLHQKGEPQLVRFENFADDDVHALLPTSAEVVAGTAELRSKTPAASASSERARAQHDPESIREMLAFTDCEKKDDYNTWVGYIKLLFDGSINWTKQPTDKWLSETALDYCNGNLKREYVDPDYLGPSTFKPHKTPGELAAIRANIDPSFNGPKITVRSLYAEAVKNGYRRQFDDRPASVRFCSYKPKKEADDGDDEGPANIFEQDIPTDVIDVAPEMLPGTIAEYAIDNAERLGVTVSMVAIPALVAAAACLHDQYQLQPREHEIMWTESARLWSMAIDRPSGAKTPAADAALKPLHKIDAEWTEKYSAAYAQYKDEKEAFDADRKTLANDPDRSWLLGEEPRKPTKRRLVTNDFTMEGLKAVLADNPAGVIIHANEVASIFGSLNQYKHGHGADRQLLVELNDGGKRVVDRKSTGELVIQNWGASVYGTIQPGTLRAIVKGRMLVEDGLFQRFMPFFGQTIGAGVDRSPDLEAHRIYTDALHRLAMRLPFPHGPIISVLDPKARELWTEIEQFRWTTYTNMDMHEGLGAYLGKFPKYFARLIMTFHGIDSVTRSRFAADCRIGRTVTFDTVQRAHALLTKFFLPQGKLVYGRLFTPIELDAQWIGKHILTNFAKKITLRELKRVKRSFNQNEETAKAAMEYLQAKGWVDAPIQTLGGNGNLGMTWNVKPDTHHKFASLVETFRAEKVAVGA
jgi:hypothetical protein